MEISEFIRSEAESRGGLRPFTRDLNLGKQEKVSHAAVLKWMRGKSIPQTSWLVETFRKNGDWRGDFALRILEVKHPGVWKEQSEA